MNALLKKLEELDAIEIIINFGHAERFDNGAGVMLPSLGDNNEFHLLRSKVLEGLSVTIRRHEPHITLMHPRNSSCTNEIFSIIRSVRLPAHLTFNTISLIEQINGGRWQVLRSYKLKDR
jgi:2'-5' RNA ligase